MNYRFHRAAVAGHLDQVVFYESRLPGLGANYLAEWSNAKRQWRRSALPPARLRVIVVRVHRSAPDHYLRELSALFVASHIP
jgi:hypothetical protein